MTRIWIYKFTFLFGTAILGLTLFFLTSFSFKKNKAIWNIGETQSKFSIAIPKDYTSELMVVDKGHFQTMFIKGPNNVPDSQKYYISIRTGFFPTYRYKEIRTENFQRDNVNVKLLGQELQFMVHFDPSIPLYLIEQIISLDNVKQGLKADISISGNFQKDTEALIKIIETLKLEGPTSTPVPSVVIIDPDTKGIFNRHRQIVKYGTVTKKAEIITGSLYYYNADGTLSKIELYKDGKYLRDSTFVK